MSDGIVITSAEIVRFEFVYTEGNSGSIPANQFVRDGSLIHFWAIDNERMTQTYVRTLHVDAVKSIRPVYAGDPRRGG